MKRFLFLMALMSVPASAYIPDFHMILSKAADNHGRGIYLVEQDVVFRGDPDPLVVKETWLIGGENNMRVNFEGKGALAGLVLGTLVYDNGSRHFLDETRGARVSRLGDDWFEPFFHFRYSKNIKSKLVALKIAPPDSLKDRSATVKNESWRYADQPYLRLSRSGGAVSYAIGTPSPPDSPTALPGLWIEQDQFTIRKIRLPSQALITADKYSRHPENLWLPQLRTAQWGAESVQIFVSNVRSLGRSTSATEALKPNSLNDKASTAHPLKLSEMQAVREFYTRFR